MKVHYDVSTIHKPQITGVGVYIVNLYRALKESDRYEIIPVVKPSRRRYRENIAQHIGQSPETLWPFSGQGFTYHGPDFRLASFYRGRKVVTIHDLAFLKPGMTSPEFAKKRIEHLKATLRQRPQAIITVSEATKKDLLNFAPEVADITTAIHLGADHIEITSKTPKPPIERPYFLFVGNLEARKNVSGLIKAFDAFSELHKNNDIQLVLVGKPGYGFEDIKTTIENCRNKDRLVFPGYVKTNELTQFYQHALGFLYPSWCEGFGIPIIEAMKSGCPVLTSSGSSTGEVAGGAAKLIDPQDTEDIVSGIEELAFDSSLQKLLQVKGLQRADEFQWSKCAKKTTELYLQ